MSGNTVKITIVTTDGKTFEKSFDVMDGVQGPKGDTGPQGPQGPAGSASLPGEVGSVLFGFYDDQTEVTPTGYGDTITLGSNGGLVPSDIDGRTTGSPITSGTFMCLGYSSNAPGSKRATLWLRTK